LFVLVPLFVCAVPVRAHWPSFALVDTHRLFGQALFTLSIHLLVPVLVWLSLVLIGAHFGFIGASFVLIQLSFALVPAWLGSFGLICTPQPLICVCIKYMVSTYILNRLTFIPCIINLCKTID
jgi:hypothetical protein